MAGSWSEAQLARVGSSTELAISTQRADGTWRKPVPIWVVRVDDAVYVRTWYRRNSGWFGHAVQSGRARIQVPGLDADVTVQDLGQGPPELRSEVDAAYLAKYGAAGHRSMVTDEAATTTLRLDPRP